MSSKPQFALSQVRTALDVLKTQEKTCGHNHVGVKIVLMDAIDALEDAE